MKDKKKGITTSSAKQKGRLLQQWVRDKILKHFDKQLQPDDVRSTGMGQQGEDIQLSPKARGLFNYSVECKSLKAIAVYKYFEQATTNKGSSCPLVVIKMNGKKPLAIVDAEHFISLINPY